MVLLKKWGGKEKGLPVLVVARSVCLCGYKNDGDDDDDESFQRHLWKDSGCVNDAVKPSWFISEKMKWDVFLLLLLLRRSFVCHIVRVADLQAIRLIQIRAWFRRSFHVQHHVLVLWHVVRASPALVKAPCGASSPPPPGRLTLLGLVTGCGQAFHS